MKRKKYESKGGGGIRKGMMERTTDDSIKKWTIQEKCK